MTVALVVLGFLLASTLVTAPLWGGWWWWSAVRRGRVRRALLPLGAKKVRGAIALFNLVGHVVRVRAVRPWHIEIDEVLPSTVRFFIGHDYGEHEQRAVGGGALLDDLPLLMTSRATDIVVGFAVWSSELETARALLAHADVVAALRDLDGLKTASVKEGTLRLVIARGSLLQSPERELPVLTVKIGALVEALHARTATTMTTR